MKRYKRILLTGMFVLLLFACGCAYESPSGMPAARSKQAKVPVKEGFREDIAGKKTFL